MLLPSVAKKQKTLKKKKNKKSNKTQFTKDAYFPIMCGSHEKTTIVHMPSTLWFTKTIPEKWCKWMLHRWNLTGVSGDRLRRQTMIACTYWHCKWWRWHAFDTLCPQSSWCAQVSFSQTTSQCFPPIYNNVFLFVSTRSVLVKLFCLLNKGTNFREKTAFTSNKLHCYIYTLISACKAWKASA